MGIVALNEVFGQWHSFVLFFVMLPLCTIGVDIESKRYNFNL